jgi:hypothetical protein
MRGLVVMTAFAIAGVIQREQDFGSELAAFFQHLIDDIGIDISMLWQLFQFIFYMQQLVHDELHIPQWRDVLTHGALLMIGFI